jgi:Protein of unknown function (DUF1566)
MSNSKELASILSYGIPYSKPTIDTGYFPNTISSFYWASTIYAGYTNDVWGVYFDHEYFIYDYNILYRPVRAVRGGL